MEIKPRTQCCTLMYAVGCVCRKFFFDGKHNMQMRGLLVLLVSKAAGPVQGSSIETRESMVSGIYPR